MSTLAVCRTAFEEINPSQLKDRLLLISENKKENIQSLNIEPCGPSCLSFNSNTGVQFKITKDPSLTKPEILLSPSSKTLKVPSYDWLHNSSSDNLLKSWLIGHEIHPYTSPSKVIQYTEAQNTALLAFKQTLKEGVKSFLHIAPTSAGKTLVMANALKEKLQNHRRGKISFVTAHQIHLVDQLFSAVQAELYGMDVAIINWNNRLNKDFYLEIERAVRRTQPTVFVITSQSLKSQLDVLQGEGAKDYARLVESTDGIYIDEAHHLGAFHTKASLLTLQERSGAFLYGTTATPAHHEVNLRELFKREHWSYLSEANKETNGKVSSNEGKKNKQTDLFYSYSLERVMEQLSVGMERGEITPFDALYIIGESSFHLTKNHPLFIQPKNHLRVINPHYYNRLVGILDPIFSSNRKGFIVTATIEEANRLTEFLSESVKGIQFEVYHSKMKREERREVLKRSKEMPSHYIVAVRALDEGVNLPHLMAYIDLNANVSVKQMVHRIGRVLRLYPSKVSADVLFLADYRDEQMAGDLLNLLDVVNVPGSHRRITYRRGDEAYSLRAPKVLPLTRAELQSLREELGERVRSFWKNRERVDFFDNREDAYQLLQRKNVTSIKDFSERRKTETELQQIPRNPYQHYKGWSWKKALGKTQIEFLKTIEEAYQLLQRKNVTSIKDFLKKRPTDPELQQIPFNPYKYYKGWSWKKALGKQKLLENKEEAYQLLQRKNITSVKDFLKRRPTDPELQQIPAAPDKYYKGWNWKKALGKQKLLENKEEAYQLLQRKNITSVKDFLKRRPTDPELQQIPATPYQHYKGWSWNKALGKQEFLENSEDAYQLLQRKNVTSIKDFSERRKTDPKLQQIPRNPHRYYKGWNWNKAIRKIEFLKTIEEAYQLLQRKNITSVKDFSERRKTDPELQQIPTNPYAHYKEWNWKKARGKTQIEFFENMEDAYTLLQRKRVTSQRDFFERRKTDPELQQIPTDPYQHYTGWSWKKARGKTQIEFFKNREDTYTLLQRKNITSIKDFSERRKTDPELQQIPTNPYAHYKGWSWKKALGKFLENSEDAYTLLQRKRVRSEKDFSERRKTDPELQQIPRNPYQHYKGWSWNKARGKTQIEFFENMEDAYQLLQRKHVRSQKDFLKRRPTDPELQQIPHNLYRHYKGWSWKKALGKQEFLKTKVL